MKCARRSWQPRPAAKPLAPRAPLVWRSHFRALVATQRPALKTAGSGAPLSLSDIIAFESEQPSVVMHEAAPGRGMDDLVDRKSRTVQDGSGMRVATDGDDPQRPSRAAATATVTVSRPGAGAAGPRDPAASDLSRAVFGGTAQVSEREASVTRQALQKTLEGAPASRPDAGSSPSANAFSGSSTEPHGQEGKEAPAWAQALFSSAAATTTNPTTTTAEPTSNSRLPSSSASQSPEAPAASTRPAGSWTPSGPPASSAPPAPAPPTPQLATARKPMAAWAPLAFADTDLLVPTELQLKSEESMLVQKARAVVLPPLQSVVDLTAAARPPSRGLDLAASDVAPEALSDSVAVSEDDVVQGGALGRRLADGVGLLADGTRFEKLSGTDTGPDGYVKRWEVLRGVTGDGTVQWEECWWKASNRFGLRELGAFKKGTAENGAAWKEEWKELLYTHQTNMRLAIERTAHKWARDENADEWEEKWGESFEEAGRVNKFADKWAKAGNNVWHERWGEDYDGQGACQKYTDKWAERLLPEGGQEQWGDKWTETFGHGKGTKHGEVWSSGGDGSRYNRWWNEEHFGNGTVRKWGNSTGGEYWDDVEHMDTYYNPVPHFGFGHAVGHSPELWSVPLPDPEEGTGGSDDDDGLGMGLGRL